MQLTPSAALAFARTHEGKKMVRYTMVSVISIVISQIVLAFAFGALHWTARSANVLATAVGTVPSYELNRKWAWGKRGKSHLWKEVAPFWTLSFIGLAFSTWSADYAETVVQRHGLGHGMQTVIVSLAALAAWGVLWVGKFIFFNKVLFRTHPQDLEPALDGRSGLPHLMGDGAFLEAVGRVVPADESARRDAEVLSDRLTKPRGALGVMERVGAQLAAIAGTCPPPVPAPAIVAVFAGDHGVVAEGVTPWPAEVTAQMVANFCAGGAAINVLARHGGAEVVVVDVGVLSELDPHPALVRAKVRAGTGNLAREPAMTAAECAAAVDAGATMAATLIRERGARCLITGDMGIGNTTASSAVIAAMCSLPAASVTGRGTGIDDGMLAHKTGIIERAVARLSPDAAPLEVLAEVGGLEIAALAGFIVGGAAERVPVLIDGVIACAALAVAGTVVPDCLGYCVAGHRSSEPGASAVLAHFGLAPLLDLDLRLGEGTGACLALPLVQASAKILREMATFDAAGVTDKG